MTAVPLRAASIRTILGVFANAVVGTDISRVGSIGSVTLLPHQQDAVRRIRDIIGRHGGALLCDEPGVGKTYVALALAAEYDRALVVAPAGLRAMWRDAARRAGVALDFASIESLGRGAEPARAPLVIVDEAHHLRNPSTRRYDAAARLCAASSTLLLTATPLHNARADVAALAALFAGVRAYAWSDGEIARVTVRRTVDVAATANLPTVERAPWCVLDSCDETVLDQITALPPPVPARDGTAAAALVAVSLARQWASSMAALRGALRRRITRGHALLHALASGMHPTRAELGAWACDEHAVQLAFVPLVTTSGGNSRASTAELHEALTRHVDALAALERRVRPHGVDPVHPEDAARARVLDAIRRRHAPERVVAFTAYADTATAMYGALRDRGHAALLTARGGYVAGGTMSREDILARFTAPSEDVQRYPPHERVDLLVATDLLSEGVNLQSAIALVHLDLPWTSARLAQRIGRVARVGSRHEHVVSYALRPPERAESVVRTLALVAAKARLASDLLGDAPALPADGHSSRLTPATIEAAEELRARLSSWSGMAASGGGEILLACVPAPVRAALALCRRGDAVGGVELVTVDETGQATSSPVSAHPLLTAAECAVASETEPAPAACELQRARAILEHVVRWDEACAAAADAGLAPECAVRSSAPERAARALASRLRIESARLAHTPFTQRTRAALIASKVRHVADSGAPIGLERSFYCDYADRPHPIPPEFGSAEDVAADDAFRMHQPLQVLALLLFGSTD